MKTLLEIYEEELNESFASKTTKISQQVGNLGFSIASAAGRYCNKKVGRKHTVLFAKCMANYRIDKLNYKRKNLIIKIKNCNDNECKEKIKHEIKTISDKINTIKTRFRL